jgi:hypothetical protein
MSMTRGWGRALATAAACTLASSAGCTSNDATLFVAGVIAPPIAAAGGACIYGGDPTQPQLSSGVLDAAFRQLYTPAVLVANQLSPQGNPQRLRAETSRITIQGVEVRVADAAGTELNAFTRLASGVVPPGTGTAPGYVAVSATIVDSESVRRVGNGLRPGESRRVVARFKFFGQTLGGQDVESNEFQFPVDVCFGCLVAFPPEASDPGRPQPNCLAGGGGAGGGGAAAACVPGQDQPTDCRACQGQPICDPAARANLTLNL